MKTKTTITVETYKFSTVRLRRERASICVDCGRKITPSEGIGGGICPSEITSEIHTQRITNDNGEIK
ncbi:MAG: hypothetical protein H7070_02845 [Saprospiraceae bacterium]|nr:hypothetical protein [Pyrinomonadaceae bacterium]